MSFNPDNEERIGFLIKNDDDSIRTYYSNVLRLLTREEKLKRLINE